MTKMKSLGIAITILWITPSLLAQSSRPRANPAAQPTENSTTSQLDRPALQQRNPRYQVMRSDILALSFSLSPELNRQVTVQPDGYINLEGAGSLYVLGMTVPEIVEVLKTAYSKVLNNPIITVDLTGFQKPYFIAGGQVGKPGQYDLIHETTLSQAIAIAGGLTPGAKSQVFLFHRVSPGWVEVKKINLSGIYKGKRANEDAFLQPGDSLFVPETSITKFRKYVPYSFGTSFGSYAPLP